MKEIELYLKERKYKKILEELENLKFHLEALLDIINDKLKELKKLRKELGYDKK